MWRLTALGIVLAWLVILLVESQQGSSDPPAPISGSIEVPDVDPEFELWTGIYHSGTKVGFGRFALRHKGDDITFVDESVLHLTVLERPQVVKVRVTGTASAGYRLKALQFELLGTAAELEISAAVVERQMLLNVRTGGVQRQMTVALAEQPSYPALLRASLRHGSLRPGERVLATTFNPISMSMQEMHFQVERREPVPGAATPHLGWRLRGRLGELESTVWLDDRGDLIREEGPMDFVMLRESAETATSEGWPAEGSPDIAWTASVPVSGRVADPRNQQSLRLRLRGMDGSIPVSDVQQVDGEWLLLQRRELMPEMTFALPYSTGELSGYLESSALIQSDHPRLRELSAQILGNDRDAQRAVRALSQWVYTYLRKVPTVSIPSALQVLDLGEGDCNEHAILLMALLRAAGIPSRLAVGLVYDNGAFLYHAWNEVWLQSWIGVDSALGQFPADVARIKLADGGTEAMLAITPYVGRLSIDVPDRSE